MNSQPSPSRDPGIRSSYNVEKNQYRIRFERALSFSLACLILLFGISRRFPERRESMWSKRSFEIIQVEYIPSTPRTNNLRVPSVPTVPLITESEMLPDEEILDITDFDTDVFTPDMSDAFDMSLEDLGLAGGDREDIGNAVNGVVVLGLLINQYGRVDSVRVVKNTTRSKSFETEVINTAFRARYIFEDDRIQKSRWIERSFTYRKK